MPLPESQLPPAIAMSLGSIRGICSGEDTAVPLIARSSSNITVPMVPARSWFQGCARRQIAMHAQALLERAIEAFLHVEASRILQVQFALLSL